MKRIVAYTDGSAVVSGKMKGRGGFATYFPDLNGKAVAYSLGFENAKTGQMEVMALLIALKSLPLKEKETLLQVYSDSEYVVKTFTEGRLGRWIANGWRNSSGIPKNLELWKKIDRELGKRERWLKLEMIHIKSHQLEKADDEEKKKLKLDENIIGNAIADRLADYKRHETLILNTEDYISKL